MPSFRDRLASRFLRLLVQSPEARAFILQQAAEAESTDEGALFDHVLAHVDDPELAKMVRKHRDDEIRHAEMFREQVKRQGVPPGDVPNDLRVIDNIDRHLGGFFDKPITDRRGVMETYLLLQVVEERALHQFGLLERAMRRVDVPAADTIAAIAKDEARHLRYCHAISRRYAPSEATRVAALKKLRRVEAEAFRDHSSRNLKHMLDRGFLPPLPTLVWRGIQAVTSRSQALPYTDFAGHMETTGYAEAA
jgi:rubrerythrin